MYAIVKTGGKQFRAEPNEVIIVEKIDGSIGDTVELGEVLLLCDEKTLKVGSPYVKGTKVRAEILRQARGPKIRGFNYKPKKNERKRWGHRQPQTYLRIIEIVEEKK
jgi:large subunit ribosomal protein L21